MTSGTPPPDEQRTGSRSLEYESATRRPPTPPTPQYVPKYWKILAESLSAILAVVAVIMGVMAVLSRNASARASLLTAAVALIVCALLARYRTSRF